MHQKQKPIEQSVGKIVPSKSYTFMMFLFSPFRFLCAKGVSYIIYYTEINKKNNIFDKKSYSISEHPID